ncbi:HDOD domain-containing protein [Thiohalobacter sp. IOR34]|uniref:HDOD domain-containing protein n=1 Tax=Thiohalobacter sp. IOR34 TaxID=3057176 RepID=UPI0025B1236C|nr:HDOD domain-containing protein [Thiohalobacter sp. IOR34]WJW76021.1 HDOD domain-containing protein [Thiohalobacter sp. IOR34]
MIPARIRHYLEAQAARYTEHHHLYTDSLPQAAEACGIDPRDVVRAVMLDDVQGPLMAILPYDHLLDFSALCRLLGREPEPLPAGGLQAAFFPDCEAGCCPPLAPAYGIQAIVDPALLERPRLYLEPGVHDTLLGLDTETFRRLLPTARIEPFSQPLAGLQRKTADTASDLDLGRFTPGRIKRRLEAFHDLPALPGTAAQILDIAANPRAHAADLARVIEQDPALAARILRYANSPLYGFPGKIGDVKSAVARVLGFDFVLNLALGISVGQSLHIPAGGPLGLDAFWRHSVYCAALVDRLARNMPDELRPRRGSAYLAGLLHNLGVLLLGQAFQNEFFLLNRYLLANPELSMARIEKYLLGVGHEQIGGWLLEAWHLPAELVVAARHHHDEHYWGDHALYAQLVLLANRALARRDIPFDDQGAYPAFSLEMLGLGARQVDELADCVCAGAEELDDLARLVA